jgi:hypothetical protein
MSEERQIVTGLRAGEPAGRIHLSMLRADESDSPAETAPTWTTASYSVWVWIAVWLGVAAAVIVPPILVLGPLLSHGL